MQNLTWPAPSWPRSGGTARGWGWACPRPLWPPSPGPARRTPRSPPAPRCRWRRPGWTRSLGWMNISISGLSAESRCLEWPTSHFSSDLLYLCAIYHIGCCENIWYRRWMSCVCLLQGFVWDRRWLALSGKSLFRYLRDRDTRRVTCHIVVKCDSRGHAPSPPWVMPSLASGYWLHSATTPTVTTNITESRTQQRHCRGEQQGVGVTQK